MDQNSSEKKSFYALVISLEDGATPKIVPGNEMYKLKPDQKAERLSPKHEDNFSKSKEYGRIVVVEGRKKLVRHFIFALHENAESLRALHEKKRFAPPKRQSMSGIIEPLSMYVFPEEAKSLQTERETTHSSAKSEGQIILDQYKKKKNKVVKEEKITATNTKRSKNSSSKSNKKQRTTGDDLVSCVGEEKKQETNNTDSSSASVRKMFTDCIEQASQSPQIQSVNNKEKQGFDQDCTLGTVNLTTETYNTNNLNVEMLNKLLPQAVSTLDVVAHEVKSLKEDFKELMVNIKTVQEDVTFIKQALSTLLEVKEGTIQIKEMLQGGGLLKKKEDEGKSCTTSSLSMISNLLKNYEETVPNDKIKVGLDKYISRNEVNIIEDTTFYLTARIEVVSHLFCEGKPENYSLTGWGGGGRALIKITDDDITSMTKILKAMSWTYAVEVNEKVVRHRVTRYTCEARKETSSTQKVIEKKISKKTKPQGPARHLEGEEGEQEIQEEDVQHADKRNLTEEDSSEGDSSAEEVAVSEQEVELVLNTSIHLQN